MIGAPVNDPKTTGYYTVDQVDGGKFVLVRHWEEPDEYRFRSATFPLFFLTEEHARKRAHTWVALHHAS